MTAPAVTMRSALDTTRRSTSPVVAPSARRTPKSRTRCWTEYARMPNTPTIASATASVANAVTITARNRCRPVAAHPTSSSVTTSRTLTSCSLSIREIAARTAGVRASALPIFDRTMRMVSSMRSWAIGT